MAKIEFPSGFPEGSLPSVPKGFAAVGRKLSAAGAFRLPEGFAGLMGERLRIDVQTERLNAEIDRRNREIAERMAEQRRAPIETRDAVRELAVEVASLRQVLVAHAASSTRAWNLVIVLTFVLAVLAAAAVAVPVYLASR